MFNPHVHPLIPRPVHNVRERKLRTFLKGSWMPYDEELVHLNNNGDGGEKLEPSNMNGWKSPSSSSRVQPSPRPRLVAKDGVTLLHQIQLPGRFQICFRNWFHLIIEQEWRTILIIFFSGFVLSWGFFGLLYYIISVIARNLPRDPDEYDDLKDAWTNEIRNVSKPRICIEKVNTLVDALLFSIETQHTIGYGYRYMTNECPPAYTVLMVQLVIGCFLQTMLAGIVVAKVLRPKKRKMEIRFSKKAAIGPMSETDHRPALQVRIADIQQNLYLAESHVRMYIRGQRELVGLRDMNVGYDCGWDRVILLWPIIIRHVIDENSPLHGYSRDSLASAEFEIIMTVEGIVEATGMTFQARTSFRPDEIVWGYKFPQMVFLNEKSAKWEVHYGMFDQLESCVEFDSHLAEIEELQEDEHPLPTASGFI